MTDRLDNKKVILGLLLAVGLVAAGAIVVPSLAQNDSQRPQGTIKVHDDEFVDPMTRNDPKVSCDFWIFGHQLEPNTQYRLEFEKKQQQGPFEPVPEETTVVTTDGEGEFNEGPFNFTDDPGTGMYRVTIFLGTQKVSSKVFRVQECPQPPPGRIPCPEDLSATAVADPVSIELDWEPPSEPVTVLQYNIYRKVGDGDFNFYRTVPGGVTEFTDFNVTVGQTYTYEVTVVTPEGESENCPQVSATAIPFFNGALAQMVAVAGSVGALVALRRRK